MTDEAMSPFEAEWGKRYPAIGQAWRNAWQHVIPFFAFAPGIRKMIYTTNAVEALHRSLRKIIKTRGSFPNDDAALKLLYLAIKNAGSNGGGQLNGRLPWANLPFSSVHAFQDQPDDSRVHRGPRAAGKQPVTLGGTSMADQQPQ